MSTGSCLGQETLPGALDGVGGSTREGHVRVRWVSGSTCQTHGLGLLARAPSQFSMFFGCSRPSLPWVGPESRKPRQALC